MGEEFVLRNGIEKILNFLKESFLISIQTSKEYKLNTYFMITFDFFLVASKLFAFYIILSIVGDLIGWNVYDYFMCFVLILAYWKFWWMHNLRGFSRNLLRGDLNNYLTKPISTYLQICSNNMSFANFVSGIFLLILIYIIAIYQNYSNFLFATSVLILGQIAFVFLRNLFEAFAFFTKNLNLFSTIYDEFDDIILKFTPKIFKETIFSSLAFIFNSVFAYFFIEILKGNFNEFNTYFPYLLTFSIIICITFVFVWNIGLKKYEAFG